MIKRLVFTAATLAVLTGGADARRENFTNGNTGKFRFLGGTNKDGNQVTRFESGMKENLSWGMRLKAIRRSTNNAAGYRTNTPKDYNGGYIAVRTYTTGHDRDRAWSAFWHWNANHTWSNEMDLVEYTPWSCQWNAYYNRQMGGKVNNPRWWRDGAYNTNLRWYPKNDGGQFSARGKSQWVGHGKARWNTKSQVRFSQRPWAFGGNANGGWRRFGDMYNDWADIPF